MRLMAYGRMGGASLVGSFPWHEEKLLWLACSAFSAKEKVASVKNHTTRAKRGENAAIQSRKHAERWRNKVATELLSFFVFSGVKWKGDFLVHTISQQ